MSAKKSKESNCISKFLFYKDRQKQWNLISVLQLAIIRVKQIGQIELNSDAFYGTKINAVASFCELTHTKPKSDWLITITSMLGTVPKDEMPGTVVQNKLFYRNRFMGRLFKGHTKLGEK